MNTLFERSFFNVAAAFCAAVTLIAATPAIANASANAAATDVAEPVRPQEEPLAGTDKRFSELFASWSALDNLGPQVPGQTPGLTTPAFERSTISVPSRMPLSGARMSSGYGMRDHPVLRQRRQHSGVDLAAPSGTPVYATADGIVGRADWYSSYGLYVSIDHGAELETRYAHLSRLSVSAGERVRKGEVIGFVGSTGRSTGPHLHYEVRVDGVAVNPIPYMVETDAQIQLAQGRRRAGQGGD
jgi:murein DD-endopeptidase MepM/ murein hydrolase activator NlpD